MSNQELFSASEVPHIRHAFLLVLPTMTAELAEYWGLKRNRPWSCVTTDFHSATFASA